MAALAGVATWAPNGIPPSYTLPTNTAPTVGMTPWYEQPPRFGARAVPAATRGPSSKLPGRYLQLFGDLFWFNHIHLIPQQLALGNILSDLVRTFEVYNGYRTATKTISVFSASGDAGITVTAGDTTPPVDIPPNRSEFYTLAVSRLGPAKLLATFTIGMASGEQIVLTVTGTRAVVWPFIAQGRFAEVHEFLSSVIEADDGSEQRSSLRDRPRQRITFAYKFGDELINSRAENLLVDWMGRIFGVPLWQDATRLTAQASSASDTLTVESTTDRDFRAGAGELLLLYAGEFSLEALEVEAVAPTSIVCSLPPGTTWPVGTLVVPVRLAFVVGQPRQRTWPTRARELTLTFEPLSSRNDASDAAFTAYLGAPVLLDAMGAASDLQDRAMVRVVDRADSATGRAFQESGGKYSALSSSFVLDFEGRTQAWRLRRFLHARFGRAKSFWLPTWRNDLAIHQTTGAGTPTLIIKAARYADQAFGAARESRRHLMIEYTNGVRDFRRVDSASVTLAGVAETLTLSANLSQEASEANVARICFLLRVRLAGDAFEFAHEAPYLGEVSVQFKEVDQ